MALLHTGERIYAFMRRHKRHQQPAWSGDESVETISGYTQQAIEDGRPLPRHRKQLSCFMRRQSLLWGSVKEHVMSNPRTYLGRTTCEWFSRSLVLARS